MSESFTFYGRIKQLSVKNCVDLSRTTQITFETEDAIASFFEKIAPDQNVIVTVKGE